MNPHLRDELVEVIREGMADEPDSLERRKAWEVGNELSVHLANMGSILTLLADAHRLQIQHDEQVAPFVWDNAFSFLTTAVNHASDQVDEILRGAFRSIPSAATTEQRI